LYIHYLLVSIVVLKGEKIMEQQTKIAIASFDQLNTLERDKYTLSKDGGVLFVYYKIRGINKKEVKKGDFVNFFVRVFNSYNTMTGRGFELYGNRLVCDNGMVVPRTLAGFSLRHQGKQKQVIQNAVQTYASRIKDIIELWSRWTEQDIHFGKVREFIKSLKLTEKPENYLIDKVLARKQPYKLWDIYNDLCYYTTHRMVNRGRNASFNQRKKETEYARKFYSFEWNS